MPSTTISGSQGRWKAPSFVPRINVDADELLTKLRSGPSTYSAQEINEQILLCDRDYDDYELEIAHLESQILFIREQQKVLQEHKIKLSSLKSPIRKLPNEILASIFDYACQRNLLQEFPWCSEIPHEQPPTTLASTPISELPTLSISSTCNRWREIANSIPALWSHLRIEVTSCEESPRVVTPFIETLQLYMQRSRDSPLYLDLHIMGGPQTVNDVPIALRMIFDLESCRRWKTVEYGGSGALMYHVSSDLSFPILEKLVISDELLWDSVDPYKQTPKLRELVIDCVSDEVPVPARLPWSSVTHIDALAQFDSMEKILNVVPDLRFLTLREATFHDLTLPESPVTSEQLEVLTLKTAVTSDPELAPTLLEFALESFTLPKLVHLEIDAKTRLGNNNARYTEHWPESAFTAFLYRSGCHLTTLSLLSLRMIDSDLISFLHLLTSLQNLTISDSFVPNEHSPITAKLISSFNRSSRSSLTSSASQLSSRTSSTLVPKLRSLSIEFTGTLFDDDAFVKMVSSRWLPDALYAAKIKVDCLREVVLQLRERNVDKTIYRPLQYLDQMGLMVVVTGKEGGI